MNPETSDPGSLRKAVDLIAELSGAREAYAALIETRGFLELGTMSRALSALVLVAVLAAFSFRAVRLLLPRAGVPLRFSSALMLGVWVATIAFHLLRALGAFQLGFALLGALVLGAATWLFRPADAPVAWVLRRELRAARATVRLLLHGRYALINGVFTLFAALYALRALLVPPLGWDTFTYHGPRAVQWLQTGQFSFDPGPGPLSLYRHFFGGSELLMAWAMLPFHSDLMVNLGTLVQWITLGLAVWALARALGLREPYAATSAGASMFIATVHLELNSGYVEIVLNAAMIHGVALAVYGLKRPRGPLFVLAAMSLGVAAGIKLPGAPPGFIVLLALSLRLIASRSVPRLRKVRALGAAALCAALPVIPWLIFAWRDTGYPLSPMPVELLGQRLGIADPALRWYQAQLFFEPYSFAAEKQALLRVFSPLTGPFNEGLGSLAIIPVLFAPFGAVALIRKRPLAGGLVFAATLVSLAIYYSRGMSPVRLLWSVSSSRFLIPVMIFAIIMSMSWCRPDGFFSIAYRRLLLAYPLTFAIVPIRWGHAHWEAREAALIGVCTCLAATLITHVTRRRGARAGGLVFLALFAYGCSFLQLRRDLHRIDAFRESFALHPTPRDWWELLLHIDDRPHRIAVTAGPFQRADQWHFYPFYGRRLQNRIMYVPPTADGGIAHFGPEGDLEQRANQQAWEARLASADIDLVLSFFPSSIEQRWMESAPDRFRKLGGGPQGGLYERLRTPPPQQSSR